MVKLAEVIAVVENTNEDTKNNLSLALSLFKADNVLQDLSVDVVGETSIFVRFKASQEVSSLALRYILSDCKVQSVVMNTI